MKIGNVFYWFPTLVKSATRFDKALAIFHRHSFFGSITLYILYYTIQYKIYSRQMTNLHHLISDITWFLVFSFTEEKTEIPRNKIHEAICVNAFAMERRWSHFRQNIFVQQITPIRAIQNFIRMEYYKKNYVMRCACEYTQITIYRCVGTQPNINHLNLK